MLYKISTFLRVVVAQADSVVIPKGNIICAFLSSPTACYQKVFYVAGVIGVALGIYYFYARIAFEKRRDKDRRQRSRLKIILDHLNQYDEHVCKILNTVFKDANELMIFRNKIIETFELLENYLEYKEKLLGFSENDKKRFLGFHSFVDKNPLISSRPFDDLNANDLLGCVPVYKEKMRDARLLCLEKME